MSDSEYYNPCNYNPIKIESLNHIGHSYFHLNAPFNLTIEAVDTASLSLDYTLAAPCYYIHEHYNTFPLSSDLYSTAMHQHDAIEIMFVLEGYVQHYIENQHTICIAGQCCIMNKWIRHVEDYSSSTFKAVFLQLSDEFITFLSNCNQLFNATYLPSKHYTFFVQHILELIHISDYKKIYLDYVPHSYTKDAQIEFEKIFEQVIENCRHSTISSNMIAAGHMMNLFNLLGNPTFYTLNKMSPQATKGEYLFRRIVQLLEVNQGNVSRGYLEQTLHYSGDYLNRLVKMNTGKSLVEYRNQFKLKNAARMILEERSVSEIMQILGYTNKTYFYKIFKDQYHMTPREYYLSHKDS